jgi:hypothetical protein
MAEYLVLLNQPAAFPLKPETKILVVPTYGKKSSD